MLVKQLSVLLAIVFAGAPQAAQVGIDTSFHPLQPGTDNQGWWASDTTNNNPTNDNYYTGRSLFSTDNDTSRSFFSFDLSELSGEVTAATFNVRRYEQPTGVTLGLFDVTTPATELITTRSNIQNLSIFNDLGSGKSYGLFNVAPGDSFDVLTFSLNAEALADINSSIGSGYFSIGAAVIGSGVIFSTSSDEQSSGGVGYIQRLVLDIASPVPEPATYVLLGIGLCALGSMARRKAKHLVG